MKSIAKLLIVVFTSLVLLAGAHAAPSVPAPLPPAAQEALNNGILAAKLPDYLLAIRYFEEARKIAPKHPVIYLNLGLAESKISGRELRAIAWFGAYLTANPGAPNAAAVKEQIAVLKVRNQSNTSRLIKSVQDAANQISDGFDNPLKDVAKLWAGTGDITSALNTVKLMQGSLSDITRDVARKEIALIQANAGDIVGAVTTADIIMHLSEKCIALWEIGAIQLKASDIAGAQKTLALAAKTAELIKDMQTKAYQMHTIAAYQASAGDIAGAQKSVTFMQGEYAEPSKSHAQRSIAKAQAQAGDIVGALKTADLIQQAEAKSSAQSQIVEAQLKAGDIAGALKTADLIQQAEAKSWAQSQIVKAQLKAGDIAGAQKTANNRIQDGEATYSHIHIAKAQIEAGDMAGAKTTLASAQKTADLLPDGDSKFGAYKSGAQRSIAEAQAQAGDIAGAQKTANLIQNMVQKGAAQKEVAAAQVNAGITKTPNSTHQSSPDTQPPIQPVITVSDWLKKLDDKNEGNYSNCPLNTGPFLDLAGYLKSLPPSDDPKKVFASLHETAKKIVSAQNVIHNMLKQKAKK